MNIPSDKPKLPFMPMRDGAGAFSLDNPDDGTSIMARRCLLDNTLRKARNRSPASGSPCLTCLSLVVPTW